MGFKNTLLNTRLILKASKAVPMNTPTKSKKISFSVVSVGEYSTVIQFVVLFSDLRVLNLVS